jgi:nickel transport system ATP-binding protein
MPQKIQLQQIALAADRPLVSDVSLTLRRGRCWRCSAAAAAGNR